MFSRTFVRDNKTIRTFGFVFLALSYNGDSVNGFNKSISVYFSLGFSRRASIEWKFANIYVIFFWIGNKTDKIHVVVRNSSFSHFLRNDLPLLGNGWQFLNDRKICDLIVDGSYNLLFVRIFILWVQSYSSWLFELILYNIFTRHVDCWVIHFHIFTWSNKLEK